jgi:carbamoyltransferase
MMTAGLGGVMRHGCVALADGTSVVGVCEQERVTRRRGAGFNSTGLPDEALDVLLERLERTRGDVGRYVMAEAAGDRTGDALVERIDHHYAHACAAYLTSPFSSAAVVVCDHETPKVSIWEGRGAALSRIEWPWTGPGFADVYSSCANAFGFQSEAGAQRLEALARLRPDGRDERLVDVLAENETALRVEPALLSHAAEQLGREGGVASPSAIALAAALQTRIGEVFLEFLARVRRHTTCEHLCLAGSFFYHSSINTLAKRSGLFKEVFVPVDPGNAGLAVGAVLHAIGSAPQPVSPFLGPAYSALETKQVLDNCKLTYSWESEDAAIGVAVDALRQGLLVGWFGGAMEWGTRALGARCILANPFVPYVLENLNRFLKRREHWRGYAISGLEGAVADHFDGPDAAPFMECDYRPRDPARFAHVLPSPSAAIRVHTVGGTLLPRFGHLLEAFGAAAGLPFVVNTSFNGFHEPIVCSPRDAVRVFYGSGLDVLVIDRFVLKK